jgi:4-alpha-glucanotransferase
MNTPGTTEGNWTWRYADEQWTGELALHLRRAVMRYGRLPGESGVVGDN